MQVYLHNTYSNLLWQDMYVMKLINLEVDSIVIKSGVCLTKFGLKLLLTLSVMCDSVGKIIARPLCFNLEISSDPIAF